jgi:hypothetical protein
MSFALPKREPPKARAWGTSRRRYCTAPAPTVPQPAEAMCGSIFHGIGGWLISDSGRPCALLHQALGIFLESVGANRQLRGVAREGFPFSDRVFPFFILMASQRLRIDRFFTIDRPLPSGRPAMGREQHLHFRAPASLT